MPDECRRTPTSTPVSIYLYPSRESPEGDLGVRAARFDYPITLKTPEPENVLHLFREEDECPDGTFKDSVMTSVCVRGAAFPVWDTPVNLSMPTFDSPIFPNCFSRKTETQHLEAGPDPPGASPSS